MRMEAGEATPGFTGLAGGLGLSELDEQRISYAEFLKLPNENQHIEWVNGQITEMSAVSLEHQQVAIFLLTTVGEFVEQHHLGIVCFRPFQMKTGPGLPGRAPDLMFVANENLSRLTNTHLEGPADLVVEITSAESSRIDRGEKYGEYQRGGVREYWVIDPEKQHAEFYQLGADGFYQLAPVADDGFYHSTVLEGFKLRPSWLWERPTVAEVISEIGNR
jgi:Uma2 family endonuclease